MLLFILYKGSLKKKVKNLKLNKTENKNKKKTPFILNIKQEYSALYNAYYLDSL